MPLRILILGGGGMLGHQLVSYLSPRHDVVAPLRRDVDARSADNLLQAMTDFRPEVVINAIGTVKQLVEAKQSIPSLEVNALLPHRLALVARAIGARLVHFSTDCVFSGRRGNYSEADTPDAEDLYGRTKLLGEVTEPHCLTLRTSLIGRDRRKTSLVEWFLSQSRVRGFRKAVFSGVTTIEMSRIVGMLIEKYPAAHGIWHVAGAPIDKCSLLTLVKKHYGVSTEIVPDDDFQCDRSLDSSRFREQFSYRPPTWDSMVYEMSGVT